MNKNEIYKRVEKQTFAKNYPTIDCPEYDPYKNFKRDPTGFYVLIKINRMAGQIEVAVCDKKHVIDAVFRGRTCQELYNTIFQYEKKNGLNWFKEKTHIAYLGKELKKAELALVSKKKSYYQE